MPLPIHTLLEARGPSRESLQALAVALHSQPRLYNISFLTGEEGLYFCHYYQASAENVHKDDIGGRFPGLDVQYMRAEVGCGVWCAFSFN